MQYFLFLFCGINSQSSCFGRTANMCEEQCVYIYTLCSHCILTIIPWIIISLPLPAIIEHVRDGSVVRALLLPDYYLVTVMLSGVKVTTHCTWVEM